MKFAWIVYGKLLTEQLSIMTLNPVLKKAGLETHLIYQDTTEGIYREISRISPDIVSYSLMFGTHRTYLGLFEEVRKRFPGIKQVCGGPLTTFYPELIETYPLDAVAIGESDTTIVPMANALLAGNETIDGFWTRRKDGTISQGSLPNLLEDLDSLPFPDREILYQQDSLLRNQEFKSFMSGRGCPYPCTYCFNHKFNEMFKGKGKMIRRKSVDYFIEEVLETKKDYGCQFAIFEDDIFIMDKEWLAEFSRKFKQKVNIPFICYGRANIIDNESVRLLKEAGCEILRMAIESGNDEIRNDLLKRKMSRETIINASELLHKHGIKLSVSNMIGLPTETIERANETLQLNIDCKVDNPTAQFFMPYPKMELTRIAIEKGHFDEQHFNDIHKNTWKFTPLRFDRETLEYFEKIQKLFTLFVLFPNLMKLKRIFFLLPVPVLYILSLFTRIYVTKNYLPKTKVSLMHRLRFLKRFIQFYG